MWQDLDGAEGDDLTPARILIVDDRPANLLALEVVLEPLRRLIVRASSGAEALHHVQESDFAVILMDVAMPDLDGMETAALIRENPRTRHIPIMFVTAQPSELEQTRRGYAVGGVDYIVKPFDPLILRSKVAAFVQLYEQAEAIRRNAERLASESGRRIAAEHGIYTKDVFIGILGHDLRTPLNVLQTGIGLLRASPDLEQHRPLLDRMDRSGKRMERLVADTLDFVRGRLAGGIRVVASSVDFADIGQNVVEELQLAHPARQIVLDRRGPLDGTADPARIAQAISNLVCNGIQHSKGEVRVLVDGSDTQRVKVQVENHGTIAADVVPRLFEPFRRGDDSTAGLGLGLFIVREIVAAHGGTVDVEIDRESDTTRFRVDLPRTLVPLSGR